MSNTSKGKIVGEIVHLCIVLVSITFITALLLGIVNQLTAPIIEENTNKSRTVAMRALMPDSEFEPVALSLKPVDQDTPTIQNIYKATKNGEDAGYCMEVLPKGFGGIMTVVVGVNADGTVAGAKVTQHSETPGLGAKAQADPTWIDQFAGKSASTPLAVTKDGGDIVPITGATITSRAVTDAVNTAVSYVQNLAS